MAQAMASLEAQWAPLCSGPLNLILQYLTADEREALQAALWQLPQPAGCDWVYELEHGCAPPTAWEPDWAATTGDVIALRYWRKYLQHIPVSLKELVDSALDTEGGNKAGQVQVVLQCVAWGHSKKRAMRKAVENGRADAVQALMQKGAAVTLALMREAAKRNRTSVMALFKGMFEDDPVGSGNERMLVEAAIRGAAEAVQLCISWGASPRGLEAAMSLAAKHDQPGTMQLCKDAGAAGYGHALTYAIEASTLEPTRLCLSWGVSAADLSAALATANTSIAVVRRRYRPHWVKIKELLEAALRAAE